MKWWIKRPIEWQEEDYGNRFRIRILKWGFLFIIPLIFHRYSGRPKIIPKLIDVEDFENWPRQVRKWQEQRVDLQNSIGSATGIVYHKND